MQEGQVLEGRYRVGRELGSGSFGRVYEGHHTALAQRVAIKVFRTDVVTMAGGPDRVLSIAKAAARVHHRNIVEVHELGRVEDTIYVVAELVIGGTLHEYLVKSGPLPWSRARAVALQIAAALKAGHKREVIHRGLRAANCFVLEDPTGVSKALRIQVTDFGFAHPGLAGGSRGEEHTSPFVGDASYTAPELSGGSPPTVRSDLYALGVLLFRMVTGALPFTGGSPYQMLAAHVEQPVPSIRDRMPHLPEQLDALVMRALAKEPEQRFESARELELALEEIAEDAGLEPEAEEGAPGAALDEAATRVHRAAGEGSPPAPARDEGMHEAFERRDEDEVAPTSMFDRRLLVPYFGPAVGERALPPEPTVMLGASFFERNAAAPRSAGATVRLDGSGAKRPPPLPPHPRLHRSADEGEEATTLFRPGDVQAAVAVPPVRRGPPPIPGSIPRPGPRPSPGPSHGSGFVPHYVPLYASPPSPPRGPVVAPSPPMAMSSATVDASLGHGAAAMAMRPSGTMALTIAHVLLIGFAVVFIGIVVGLAMTCPAHGSTSSRAASPALEIFSAGWSSHAQRT